MHYPLFGDLINAVRSCSTIEEAQEVFDKAVEDNPGNTKANIHYILNNIGSIRLHATFESIMNEE